MTRQPIQFKGDASLKAVIERWQGWLTDERRASVHTIDGYCRDLAAFFDHLSDHLGAEPNIDALSALKPSDFRSFLAKRAAEGVQRSSQARSMSSLRSFFRFLDRNDIVHNAALAAVRTPKPPRSVPKPLAVDEALDVVGAAGELQSEPWQAARDVALMSLLYGCGLRLGEALSLTRRQIPRGDAMTITGKGRKQRLVPLLPAVIEAVQAYVKLCPPSSGRRWAAVRRRARQGAQSGRGAAADADFSGRGWVWPTPPRHMRCATVSPRIFWPAAAICAPFRNCWVTRRSAPPSAIREVDAAQIGRIYNQAHPRAKAKAD